MTLPSWHARLITPGSDLGGNSPLLRGEFRLAEGHGEVVSATLFLSALGVVEAWVNGRRASEDLLTPGWSSYAWRIRYAELDVTPLVGPGPATVLGLALGNGWYRGRLTPSGGSAFHGDQLAGFAELRVGFADGHVQVVGTDASWTSGPSATTSDDLYDGQHIDAREYDEAWLAPEFTPPPGWAGVRVLDDDLSRLQPCAGPPVRRQSELVPQKVWSSPGGKVLADFGQNLVGWVRAEVSGAAGDLVTVRHAEVLEDGESGILPLRTAKATDRFTLSGGGADVFEPTLTFHGFRYVEVDGWPGGAEALRERGGLTAVAVGSDMRRIGRFETSNPLVNRLHENAVWSMRGNFLALPMDCPRRDEPLGRTGDIAAFAPGAAFLFDTGDFLRDRLRDLALEQAHRDHVDHPEELAEPDTPGPWSDASVQIPWAVWTAYGDRRVLEEAFPSMLAHARRVRGRLSADGLWGTGRQFGDRLEPEASAPMVATLCAHRTADLVARTAEVLRQTAEAAEFGEMADGLRTAFRTRYVRDGVIESCCATVHALAVVFGVLDDADREFAGRRLAELVEAAGHRIPAGFAGAPFVTDALTATGHLDTAYRLLLQTEPPSWLHPVTMGATTIWEHRDSMLPDGTLDSGEPTSFNHCALGAVVDWLHRVVGGLAPLEPGYHRILVAPRPGGDLTWAESSLETPRGLAAVRWELVAGRLRVAVTVPAGSEAVLRLPGGAGDEVVGPGRYDREVAVPPAAPPPQS